MMRYDFDHLPERRPTDSIKWNFFDEDVLPLWVADMDFPVAEPILEALHSRISHGIFGYPDVHPKPGSVSELQQVLVERMHRLYSWEVSPEEVVLLPGVITGLNLTCQAVAGAGGSVVVQTPVYPPFLGVAGNAGMRRQDAVLFLRNDGQYEVDWEAFEAGFTDQTRLFLLCSPHNPVGRVWREDELARMAEICLRRGVMICSDEIHCDIIFNGHQHIPIASLDKEIGRSTVTLMAPTKTFNLAGLQCSFAIVPDQEMRQKIEHTKRGLVSWVNLAGMTAALAAYRDGQEWLTQVLEYLHGNRDYLFDYVKANLPDVEMAKPEGTYLAWMDCRQVDLQECACDFFISKARVGLNDGATFGAGGEGFVRLNFACSRAVLAEALERMKLALERERSG